MASNSHAKYLVISNADLLPTILSNLDRRTLLSSALVSHLFNTIATKIIYGQVSLKTVKNVDSFLNTLNRTTNHILYNTIHTNEYLVNIIQSITIDSPNLAYLSGEKLSKCISECKNAREVVVGKCTLNQSIIMAITQLERLSMLKFRRCSIIDTNILNFLISGNINSSSSSSSSSSSNFIPRDISNMSATNAITSTTATTIITTTNPTNTNKLKTITKKLLHKHSATTLNSNEKKIPSIPKFLPKSSEITRLTHLTIDIQPSFPSQLLISLIRQNKNIKSLDFQFQGLDESLLTICQYSRYLEYLSITEIKHLSEKTIIQLITNCFSTGGDSNGGSNNSYPKLKKLLIDYGPFSEKFLFSLSKLCKTQRKISITQQPETDYHGFDLIFTNDSIEILLDNCKEIGHLLLNFHLNVDAVIEELILDGIGITADSLNMVCAELDFNIFKLQNIPTLTKKEILNGIKSLSTLKYLFVTERSNDDDTNNNGRDRLERLNYDDFNELAQNCPNLMQIHWNHKKFIDKFKIPSKFIQVID